MHGASSPKIAGFVQVLTTLAPDSPWCGRDWGSVASELFLPGTIDIASNESKARIRAMSAEREATEPTDLASRRCIPCRGGVAALTKEQYKPLLAQLEAWVINDDNHLEKTFQFGNFSEALSFVNHVGAEAEENGHHPDIYLSWGKVRLTFHTYAIDGLTESDFVMAAKSDALLSGQ